MGERSGHKELRRRTKGDQTPREQLTKGLFNTLNHAKEEDDLEQRDALLEELRHLRADYPDDPEVREQLDN